jgi:nitroreductase/NAD-dependent dihydropyrimidine dehydrogenase PreA subunit
MSLFEVDHKKCARDGICAAVCPIGIIEFRDRTPVPAADAEKRCISCGHCVAACPKGALSHRAMRPEECKPLRKELNVTREQAGQLLSSRRSIRVYEAKEVERPTIEALINIARYAPTGMNSQPVNWMIISGGDVHRLSGMVIDWMRFVIEKQPEKADAMRLDRIVTRWEQGDDFVCRNAPHVIVAHAPAEMISASTSCTLSLAYLELAAATFGLGACWAGYFYAAAVYWPPMQQALALPEGEQVHGAMMLGYPKYRYHRIPVRRAPRIEWR